MLCVSVYFPRYSTAIRGFNPCTQSYYGQEFAPATASYLGGTYYEQIRVLPVATTRSAIVLPTYRAKYTNYCTVRARLLYGTRTRYEYHIFTKFETRITRHETIRHDLLCVSSPTFLKSVVFNPCILLYKRGFRYCTLQHCPDTDRRCAYILLTAESRRIASSAPALFILVPTTNCLLPYCTSYLLPTTYYLLPATHYYLLGILPDRYYLLPTTYYLLPTTYYLLPTTYYLLGTT